MSSVAALADEANEADDTLAVTDPRSYHAQVDGLELTLTIGIDKGRPLVAAVSFVGGTPSQQAILERLRKILVGMPPQEVAEHGAIHALTAAPPEVGPAPVAGIRNPRNAGADYLLIERLLRIAYRAYLDDGGVPPGHNFWNPRLAPQWLRMRKEQQAEELKLRLAEFLAASGFDAEMMWISDIERGFRIVMSFREGVEVEKKPKILLNLERYFRDTTGMRLEVYLEEMTDQNKIRRI